MQNTPQNDSTISQPTSVPAVQVQAPPTLEARIKAVLDKITVVEKSERGASFKKKALKPLQFALSALLAQQEKNDKISGRRASAKLLQALEKMKASLDHNHAEHTHGPDCDHDHEEAPSTT